MLAGLALQLGAAVWFSGHIDPDLARLMPDDAMYYLGIAANIADGHGSVFSAGEPTNGYHPLWMAVLAGLHAVFRPGREAFVRIALLAAVACSAAAAVVLRRLLAEAGLGPRQATLGLLLFLLSPWFVLSTLSGLETPLFLLCLFLFFRAVLGAARDGPRAGIELGLSAGLLMLARTDAIFFTAGALLWLAIAGGRRGLARAAAAFAVASLVMLPWLAWNQVRFGTVVQSSAVAVPAWARYQALSTHHTPLDFARLFAGLAAEALGNAAFGLFQRSAHYGAHARDPLRVALLVAIALQVAAAVRRALAGRRLRLPAAVWLAPPPLVLGFYVFVRMYVQVWHLAPLFVAALLAVCAAVPERRLEPRRVMLPAGAILLALSLLALRAGWYWPQQADDLVAKSIAFRAGSPRRLKVGITDCGYRGYFGRHQIVNLDGVVNQRAAHAILAGRFSDYVERERFDEVRVDPARLEFYDRNRAGEPRTWTPARDDSAQSSSR
ncbi:MAG TPA: glycosyltransferase family 39 protein [Candidatus Eisenbacteria bacterium]|jgi:hypothetical protein